MYIAYTHIYICTYRIERNTSFKTLNGLIKLASLSIGLSQIEQGRFPVLVLALINGIPNGIATVVVVVVVVVVVMMAPGCCG